MFYTVVVQAVILYGSKTWVMYSRISKMLGGFHHQTIHRLMGQTTQRNGDRT